jgi:2-oxoglutarate dehydrogenase E1 component
MGAWNFMHPQLEKLLPDNASLEYVGRVRSASPAVGSYALHNQELTELKNKLFGGI